SSTTGAAHGTAMSSLNGRGGRARAVHARRGERGAGPAADRRRDGATVHRAPGRDRAVVLPRMDHSTNSHRPTDRRRNSEVATTLCRAGIATHSPGTWSYPMTAQPIQLVIDSECLKGDRR